MGNSFSLKKLICPSKRAILLSLKKGNSFVPQKGQSICPSKRAIHLSIKKANLFVPQKGQSICPSKKSTYLPFKIVNPFVPQKTSFCTSKRATHLSLKKVNSLEMIKLFVPQKVDPSVHQKGRHICPIKQAKLFLPQKGQLICPSQRSIHLSPKKDNPCVLVKSLKCSNIHHDPGSYNS